MFGFTDSQHYINVKEEETSGKSSDAKIISIQRFRLF